MPDAGRNVPSEEVKRSELFQRLGVREPSKASTAHSLATVIVWSFAFALLLSFAIGFFVMYRSTAIDDKVLTASTEFLKTTGSIFAPLLAFVFGYYFSKKDGG
jgi:ABC-type nitrate/sulfonate/bicarbonate transport system permease component